MIRTKSEFDAACARATKILDDARAGGRPLTDAERTEANQLISDGKSWKEVAQLRAMIADGAGGPETSGHGLGTKALAAGFDIRTPVVLGPGEAWRPSRIKSSFPGVDGFFDIPEVVPFAGDARYLYPSFAQRRSDPSVLTISDFALNRGGSGEIDGIGSGDIERDPMSTDPKAEIDLHVGLAGEPLRQLAVVLSGVPNAVLEASSQLADLLSTRMRYELDRALDAHVVSQIDAAGVTVNTGTGSDLIALIREAVTVARAQGANPTVLAVAPEDAEQLDLAIQPGSSGDYVFATRSAGVASPLWNLRIVESPAMSGHAPLVIDPAILGVLYASGLVFAADPYSGFKVNTTDIRAEGMVLFHVRDANGAVEVGIGS
jgi:Phage capsid family